jgi:hypothetical protein
MSLGDSWSNTTPASSSKLNVTNVISGTGAYLATLDKTRHKIFVCTSTGSGFTVNHVYLCNIDGLSVTDITDVDVHTHSGSSSGGGYDNIIRANMNIFDTGAYLLTNPFKSKWVEDVSVTGVITDHTDGTTFERSIKLDTGATSASTASIKQVGLEWDCTKESGYKCLHRIETATSIAIKEGFNMENLDVANDNERKYGHEVCTTVNNNWFATSADGTTRSSSDTGTAMNTNRTSFRAECTPSSPKIDLYIDEGTVFTKSSNIPTTYLDNTATGRLWRVSLKNNTGASRPLYFYGVHFVYQGPLKWDEQ